MTHVKKTESKVQATKNDARKQNRKKSAGLKNVTHENKTESKMFSVLFSCVMFSRPHISFRISSCSLPYCVCVFFFNS